VPSSFAPLPCPKIELTSRRIQANVKTPDFHLIIGPIEFTPDAEAWVAWQ
jgi:hypothetical protein